MTPGTGVGAWALASASPEAKVKRIEECIAGVNST